MFHTIQFNVQLMVDLEVSPKQRMERMLIQMGSRLQAQTRPFIVEGEFGPVEVADLFFEDGTTINAVPYEYFSFVDDEEDEFETSSD